MNNSKLLFLPPLLVSILLFTVSNLKFGLFLNNFSLAVFGPVTRPIALARLDLQKKQNFYLSLPETGKVNREQKVLIAHLIWENETLKQALKESKTQDLLQSNYKKVLPIKISSLTGKIIATSSQSLSEVKPGMPVVSGNILLGQVTEVSDSSLNIIPLEDDLFPNIAVRGSTGPKGVFRHVNGTSQIINVSSQTPLILGDFVLTEATDIIPANLLIGKITKLLTSPQEPIQKGEINIYDTLQNSPDNLVIILKP